MTDLHTRTFCIASWPSESAGQRQAHPWAERQREQAYTAVVRARKFRRLRIVKKQGHLLGGLVDWDRAEVTFQGRGDRFYPARKSAFTQPLKVAPWPPGPQPSECQRKITFVLGFQSRCANVWPVGSTSPRRNSTRGSHDQSGPAHCWLPLVAAR